MSVIYYDLKYVTTLENFVSAPKAGGGWTSVVSAMPSSRGIYLIWNRKTANFYIGITGNLKFRFGPRLEAVVTLGLDDVYMRSIVVWYGAVRAFNTPVYPVVGGGPPLLAPLVLPTSYYWVGTPPAPPAIAPPPAIGAEVPVGYDFKANIDGVVGVNLEHLLIQFYLSLGSLDFKTTTNTRLATPFQNATSNGMDIVVGHAGSTFGGWRRFLYSKFWL